MNKQTHRCLPVLSILAAVVFIFCSFSWTKSNSPRISFKSEKLKLNTESISRNKGELLSFELWFEQKLKKSESPESTNLLWEIVFEDNTPFTRNEKLVYRFNSTTLYNSINSNPKVKSGDLHLGEINHSGEFDFIITVTDAEDDHAFGETSGRLIVSELVESDNDLGGF